MSINNCLSCLFCYYPFFLMYSTVRFLNPDASSSLYHLEEPGNCIFIIWLKMYYVLDVN